MTSRKTEEPQTMTYDELDQKGKEKAIREWNSLNPYYNLANAQALLKFADDIGIKIQRWKYGGGYKVEWRATKDCTLHDASWPSIENEIYKAVHGMPYEPTPIQLVIYQRLVNCTEIGVPTEYRTGADLIQAAIDDWGKYCDKAFAEHYDREKVIADLRSGKYDFYSSGHLIEKA